MISIPPFTVRLDEDCDDAPVSWLRPGTISQWAMYHYVDGFKACGCKVEVSKLEVDYRQPPIVCY